MATLGLSGFLILVGIALALIGIRSEIKAVRQLLEKHWSVSEQPPEPES